MIGFCLSSNGSSVHLPRQVRKVLTCIIADSHTQGAEFAASAPETVNPPAGETALSYGEDAIQSRALRELNSSLLNSFARNCPISPLDVGNSLSWCVLNFDGSSVAS